MRLIAIVMLVALGGGTIAVGQPAPKRPPTKKVDLGAEISALGGPDLEAAIKAAEALGASPQPEAHDALLDALALGLPGRVAITAMSSLALHPAPADVVALKRYAGHHNPNVRAAAITALAAYPDPVAKATIVAALHDPTGLVRTAGAGAAGKGRVREAVDSLLKLLAKGEEASARSLAVLADPDLARKIADHYGKVPEAPLALALGLILRRADFGPDPARVEVVRAIAKIQDPTAVKELQDYIAATPKTPPRPSLQEAKLVIDARGGK